MNAEQAQLVEDHIELARMVASKICRKHGIYKMYDELYSICLESLCNSAVRFDSRGSFEAFAGQQMHWAYIDWVRVTTKRGKAIKAGSLDYMFNNQSESEYNDGDPLYLKGVVAHEDTYDVELSDSLVKHLSKLSDRDRQILLDFADGGINYAAQKHGLTKGRISQIRSKARQQWQGKNGG